MKRWSKLQKRIYNLLDPCLDIQIHCVSYPMRSQSGSTNIPRYYITLDKEIIRDYPQDFRNNFNSESVNGSYPYINEISAISGLIEEYIETPKDNILDTHFPNDRWGLIEILRSADRRTGTRRLQTLHLGCTKAASFIIKKRISSKVK